METVSETVLGGEAVRAILGRRSIRVFEERGVEEEKVDVLLQCAFAAPSSRNYHPCHFVVVDDRNLLAKIGKSSDNARMVGGAPLAIAVCVDVARYEKEHRVTDGTWIEDAACAMENILIAARALGLDGVWMQVMNRPEREGVIPPLLNLPAGVRMMAMAVLGYGAETKAPHGMVSDERLHRNGW